MSTDTEHHYFVPSITPDVEVYAVSLRDFNIGDIREYLSRHDNHELSAPTSASLSISGLDINRIDTLALCGQRQQAVDYLLSIVSDHIGRTI